MSTHRPYEQHFPNNAEWWGLLFGVPAVAFTPIRIALEPDRFLLPGTFRDWGLLVLFVVVFGVGVFGVVEWVRTVRSSVRLYDDVIVIFVGLRRTTIALSDIVAVYGGVPLRSRGNPTVFGVCYLELADGSKVWLPDTVEKFPILAERIQEAVLTRLWGAAETALRRGEELKFGTVNLRADGVRAGGRFVPWSKFEGFGFPKQSLGFWTENYQWAAVTHDEIPNEHLFLVLARTFSLAAGAEAVCVENPAYAAFHPLASPVFILPQGSAIKPTDEPGIPSIEQPVEALPPVPKPHTIPTSRHAVTWRSLVAHSNSGTVVFTLLGLLVFLGGIIVIQYFVGVRPLDELIANIAGLLALAVLIAFTGYVIGRRWILEVVLSDEGLTLTRRRATVHQSWEAVSEFYIEEIWMYGPADRGTRHAYCWLRLHDGHVIWLDLSLSDYDNFVQTVQRAVTATQLPTTRHALATGNEIAFGPVHLDAKGIALGKIWITWPGVERVHIGNGQLVVRSRDSQVYERPLKDIPNYLVLLNLIHDQIGERLEGF